MGFRTSLHPLGGGNNGAYRKGEMIFSRAVPGDYTLEILEDGVYQVDSVGAGGGASTLTGSRAASGGGGAYLVADFFLAAGLYKITVGHPGASVLVTGLRGNATDNIIEGICKIPGGRGGLLSSNGTGSLGEGAALPILYKDAVSITAQKGGYPGEYVASAEGIANGGYSGTRGTFGPGRGEDTSAAWTFPPEGISTSAKNRGRVRIYYIRKKP